MLSSDRFKTLLEEMKGEYDCVIQILPGGNPSGCLDAGQASGRLFVCRSLERVAARGVIFLASTGKRASRDELRGAG